MTPLIAFSRVSRYPRIFAVLTTIACVALLSGCTTTGGGFDHEDPQRKQPRTVGPSTNAQKYFLPSGSKAAFDTTDDNQSYASFYLENYGNPHSKGLKNYFPAFSVRLTHFPEYTDEDYKAVFGVSKDQALVVRLDGSKLTEGRSVAERVPLTGRPIPISWPGTFTMEINAFSEPGTGLIQDTLKKEGRKIADKFGLGAGFGIVESYYTIADDALTAVLHLDKKHHYLQRNYPVQVGRNFGEGIYLFVAGDARLGANSNFTVSNDRLIWQNRSYGSSKSDRGTFVAIRVEKVTTVVKVNKEKKVYWLNPHAGVEGSQLIPFEEDIQEIEALFAQSAPSILSSQVDTSIALYRKLQKKISESHWFTEPDKTLISRAYILRGCNAIYDAVPEQTYKKAVKTERDAVVQSLLRFENKIIKGYAAADPVSKKVGEINKRYQVK